MSVAELDKKIETQVEDELPPPPSMEDQVEQALKKENTLDEDQIDENEDDQDQDLDQDQEDQDEEQEKARPSMFSIYKYPILGGISAIVMGAYFKAMLF